jgi:hypothetical protein
MSAIVTELKSIQISQIPYWEIESIWASVSPMIQKAVEIQDEWSLDGIHQGLVNPSSNMQLWRIPNICAVVTIIMTYQTGVRKCLLFMCGGQNIKEHLHLLEEIESWAKKYFGCHKTIIHGRPGWERLLKGYERVTVCLEKRL